MKGIFAFLLLMLYGISSTGMTIQMHYCMGKLVSENLNVEHSSNCSQCGMLKTSSSDNNCCKDEMKQVKIEQDHQASQIAYKMMQVSVVEVPAFFYIVSEPLLNSISEDYPRNNAPPGIPIPLYKRNCIFLI